MAMVTAQPLAGFGFGGGGDGAHVGQGQDGFGLHGSDDTNGGPQAAGFVGACRRRTPGNLESFPDSSRVPDNLGGSHESKRANYPGLAGGGALAAERNRVLRNTYWLLALSMVPTVLGAWIGVQTGHRALTPASA
jgi:hypothetical protein